MLTHDRGLAVGGPLAGIRSACASPAIAAPSEHPAPAVSGNAAAEIGLGPAEAAEIVQIARRSAGLFLDPSKTDFLALRVSRRLRALGLSRLDAYLPRLKGAAGAHEARLLVETLTTHTTDFFRERHHYDWLAGEGLARLGQGGAGRDRPLVIWSAACSTGAELWSAGMVAAGRYGGQGRPGRMLLIGTDYSRQILRRARGATYAEAEIAGLGEAERSRFLMRSRRLARASGRPVYRIVPELRAQARFGAANLVDLDGLVRFTADVVFLRNVLIYFDAEVQRRVVDAVVARLRPGGFLLTGHAESVSRRPDLAALGRSIYQRL